MLFRGVEHARNAVGISINKCLAADRLLVRKSTNIGINDETIWNLEDVDGCITYAGGRSIMVVAKREIVLCINSAEWLAAL